MATSPASTATTPQMKCKFDFVNGSTPSSAVQDSLYSIWKRCNTLVLSWINHSVSPDIATSIVWVDSASDVWQDLFLSR